MPQQPNWMLSAMTFFVNPNTGITVAVLGGH
jgi:hypothetical protein